MTIKRHITPYWIQRRDIQPYRGGCDSTGRTTAVTEETTESGGFLFPFPHIHSYRPTDIQAMEEYMLLGGQLEQYMERLLEMAKSGQPLKIGTAPNTKEIPLRLRQGKQHQIVTVRGDFGEIHVLLPTQG